MAFITILVQCHHCKSRASGEWVAPPGPATQVTLDSTWASDQPLGVASASGWVWVSSG